LLWVARAVLILVKGFLLYHILLKLFLIGVNSFNLVSTMVLFFLTFNPLANFNNSFKLNTIVLGHSKQVVLDWSLDRQATRCKYKLKVISRSCNLRIDFNNLLFTLQKYFANFDIFSLVHPNHGNGKGYENTANDELREETWFPWFFFFAYYSGWSANRPRNRRLMYCSLVRTCWFDSLIMRNWRSWLMNAHWWGWSSCVMHLLGLDDMRRSWISHTWKEALWLILRLRIMMTHDFWLVLVKIRATLMMDCMRIANLRVMTLTGAMKWWMGVRSLGQCSRMSLVHGLSYSCWNYDT